MKKRLVSLALALCITALAIVFLFFKPICRTSPAKHNYVTPEYIVLLPTTYDSIEYYGDGLLRVQVGTRLGLMDIRGQEIAPLGTYDRVWSFSDGLAAVRRNGKWGFINEAGEEVIQAIYDDIDPLVGGFADSVALASLGGKWGIIDKNGESIVPFTYDHAHSFRGLQGLAVVSSGGKQGIITKTGDVVLPLIYDSIDHLGVHYTPAAQSSAVQARSMPPGQLMVRVRQGGKWGAIMFTTPTTQLVRCGI